MPLPNLGGFLLLHRIASRVGSREGGAHGSRRRRGVRRLLRRSSRRRLESHADSDGAPDPHVVHNSMRADRPRSAARAEFRRAGSPRLGMRGVGDRLKHRFRVRPRTLRRAVGVAACVAGSRSDNPLLSRRFVAELDGYSPLQDVSHAVQQGADRPAVGPVSLSRSAILSAGAAPYGRSI